MTVTICHRGLMKCFWERSFNCEKVFNDMQKSADSLGIKLTDTEEFDYDTFFWNVYQCTEKGLS
jgi:hypothetical protein